MPGYGINGVRQADLSELVGTRALTSGAFAIDGTNTENVETASAVDYILDGVFGQLAATAEFDVSGLTGISERGDLDDQADAWADQADLTDCLYMLVYDGTNTRVVKGKDRITADGAPLRFPNCPGGHVAFAGLLITNTSGAIFKFGTTALDDAGIADTYYNISASPGGDYAP